jgi:hypothetical protein
VIGNAREPAEWSRAALFDHGTCVDLRPTVALGEWPSGERGEIGARGRRAER